MKEVTITLYVADDLEPLTRDHVAALINNINNKVEMLIEKDI